jgi:haloalkane dehalogenase
VNRIRAHSAEPSACGQALAHREAGPADGPVALLLHGFPESSYMWRELMPALAGAGWRAVAPDLAGFGDSPPDPPGTWERHMEAVERFRREQGIERCVPVVHDWGGLIGLRWACEHPDAVDALVISSAGFFADGKWHEMASAMRTPGTGEELVDELTRDGFAAVLRSASPGFGDDAIDEYWRAFADEARRHGHLELYRSGDFEKLAGYRLADLDVPVLLVWGEGDEFAPVAGAHRFERELADTELVVVDGAGHFVWEDAPERCAEAVTGFLARISSSSASST